MLDLKQWFLDVVEASAAVDPISDNLFGVLRRIDASKSSSSSLAPLAASPPAASASSLASLQAWAPTLSALQHTATLAWSANPGAVLAGALLGTGATFLGWKLGAGGAPQSDTTPDGTALGDHSFPQQLQQHHRGDLPDSLFTLAAPSSGLYVAALKNIDGVSCFINALLQAFASIDTLKTFLISGVQSAGSDYKANLPILTSLAKLLFDLSLRYTGASDRQLTAESLISALSARYGVMSSGQQDAHELFVFVSHAIKNELSAYHLSLTRTLAVSPKEPAAVPGTSFQTFNPFVGLSTSQLTCNICGHKGLLRLEIFDNISLSLYNMSLDCTLQDCLYSNFAQQQVEYKCDVCSKRPEHSGLKGSGTLQNRISHFPDVFCFHLSRLLYAGSSNVKASLHVSFPLELDLSPYAYTQSPKPELGALNYLLPHFSASSSSGGGLERLGLKGLSRSTGHTASPAPSLPASAGPSAPRVRLPFVEKPASNARFRLCAVMVHLGGGYGGHFITYRRMPGTAKRKTVGGDASPSLASSSSTAKLKSKPRAYYWLRCSDESISMVPEREVLQCEAYMLFYERADDA